MLIGLRLVLGVCLLGGAAVTAVVMGRTGRKHPRSPDTVEDKPKEKQAKAMPSESESEPARIAPSAKEQAAAEAARARLEGKGQVSRDLCLKHCLADYTICSCPSVSDTVASTLYLEDRAVWFCLGMTKPVCAG